MEQVAHEGGLAGAERAVQFDEGIGQPGVARQGLGRGSAGGLVGPVLRAGF